MNEDDLLNEKYNEYISSSKSTNCTIERMSEPTQSSFKNLVFEGTNNDARAFAKENGYGFCQVKDTYGNQEFRFAVNDDNILWPLADPICISECIEYYEVTKDGYFWKFARWVNKGNRDKSFGSNEVIVYDKYGKVVLKGTQQSFNLYLFFFINSNIKKSKILNNNYAIMYTETPKGKQLSLVDKSGFIWIPNIWDYVKSTKKIIKNIPILKYNKSLYDFSLLDENLYDVYIYINGSYRKIEDGTCQVRSSYEREKIFTLKYEPVVAYPNNILLEQSGKYYLYNTKEEKYKGITFEVNLEYPTVIPLDNNILVFKSTSNEQCEIFYFDDKSGNYFKITDLLTKEELKQVTDGKIPNVKVNIPILSFKEYKEEYLKNPAKKDDYEDMKKRLDRIKNQERIKRLEYEKKKVLESYQEQQERANQEMTKLYLASENLDENVNKNYHQIPITSELLFKKVEDHLEIIPEYLNYLRYFNLSGTNISFKNVKVVGIDFRKTNAVIEPQEVYQKDISYCKFSKDNLLTFTNFDGVRAIGTDFSECEYVSLNNAIVNEETIYPDSKKSSK